jgi:hypothetical protein
MDRRTAIKHLGGVACALLLAETLRVEYVKAFFQMVNWDIVSGQFVQKA